MDIKMYFVSIKEIKTYIMIWHALAAWISFLVLFVSASVYPRFDEITTATQFLFVIQILWVALYVNIKLFFVMADNLNVMTVEHLNKQG